MVFLHLQTVWEAEDTNTPERGLRETKKHGIRVPVGYDAHVDGARVSTFMHRFGTGGTPWSVVIDKKGVVRFSEVTPGSVDRLAERIEELRAAR